MPKKMMKMKMKKQSVGMWILCVLGLVIILMCVTAGTNFEYFDPIGLMSPDVDNAAPVCALFSSDSCGHCKNFQSTWDKFKNKNGHRMKIEQFKAGENADLMTKHKVDGFPTVRLYKEGMSGPHEEYSGDRSLESLEAFISKEGFEGMAPLNENDSLNSLQGSPGAQSEEERDIQTTDATDSIDNFVPGYSDIEHFNIEGLDANNAPRHTTRSKSPCDGLSRTLCENRHRCEWDRKWEQCRDQ